MAINELFTRIALKYDSYANWTNTNVEGKGGNLVLLAGEIGICEIPGTVKSFVENGKTVTVETAPTVLFKVGGAKNDDGTLKAFKDLPWASAKAADVYNWAKASEVKRVGKELVFVGGNADGTDKKVAFDYVTSDEVTAITNPIAQDLAELTETVDDIKESLETLIGEETGSIADAIAAAEGRAAEDAQNKANAAQSAAEGYAKGLDDTTNLRIDGLAETVGKNAEDIAKNAEAIRAETEAREAAIGAATNGDTPATGVYAAIEAGNQAINAKIGTTTDSKDTATVYGAIAKVKADAVTDAQTKVDTLANGTVASNTSRIGTLEQTVAGHVEDIAGLKEVDADYKERIEKIEAFFVGAAEDEGEGESLKNALDTLKEIQDYASGDGTAAAEMLEAIEANTKAIEDAVGENGTVTQAVAQNTQNISGVGERVSTLETLTAGFDSTIKEAVDAAAALAQDGVDAASAAQEAAEAAQDTANDAQDRVSAVEDILTGDDGLVDTVGKNTSDIADVTGRVDTAEGEIDTLQELTGNHAIAIEALQELTAENGTIRNAIAEAKTAADDAQEAAEAAQGTADAAAAVAGTNAEEIAAIKADYVKVKNDSLYFGENMIIFNCGSASEVI